MSATQPTMDLTPWIELSSSLSPFENLALMGLLELRADLTPDRISKSAIIQEENFRASERWLSGNFREALRFYCSQMETQEIKVISELAKSLAPLFVAHLSLGIGAAMGFIFFGIGYKLNRWCEKYSTKEFTGKGLYVVHADNREVEGYFNITHSPMILETVKDPDAQPAVTYKIDIKEPEQNTCLVKVPTKEDVDQVVTNFGDRSSKHSFNFTDAKTQKNISGEVQAVSSAIRQGPTMLEFSTPKLNY